MTQATPKDYWISPNAVYIEFNSTGNPDYIQASCVSGAQILVYIKDVIDYDAGHNYQRWSLQASPTVFNTHTEKYVYVAIPRGTSTGYTNAMLVFPSEVIDIYGKNADEEQIGSADYYYIFLQGIITSSGDNGSINRDWAEGHSIATGYLSSDEAIAARPNDSEWYSYSTTYGIVTFLKNLTMKVGTVFRSLFARSLTIVKDGSITFEDSGELKGPAQDSTPVTSQDRIVTPKYMDDNTLSSKDPDTAQGRIAFAKGLTTGAYSEGVSGGSVDADGNAEVRTLTARGGARFGKDSYIKANGAALLGDVLLDALRSKTFDDVLQRGFGLVRDAQGRYSLSVHDLMVWGKAMFTELEIRRLSSVGGNVYLSGASGRIQHVAPLYASDGATVSGWKCWLLADDGTTATQNGFVRYDQARCQTFNIEAGVHEGVGNRYYWRLVTDASTANEQITDSDGNVLYDGKRFAWVVLSATDCENPKTNDAPAEGDVIVLDGHRQFAEGDEQGRDKYNDRSRTNVMMLQTTGTDTGATPNIVALTGITDYRHSTDANKYANTVFILSPEEVVFVSTRMKWISASGDNIVMVNFRGPWEEDTAYYYYDQVSHGNALWTCVVADGKYTMEEPSDTSTVWRKELTGGVPGEKGEDGVAYLLQVTSDRGTVLVNGSGTLTLTGTLYRNGEDITSTIASSYWSWYRVSADTADDAVWGRLHEGKGNTCVITSEDVSRVAQFGCRAYVPDATLRAKGRIVDSLNL